ncbi:hypothetical protein DLREEDagrD3_10760 [Denitratisoma sp. agr-D3]
MRRLTFLIALACALPALAEDAAAPAAEIRLDDQQVLLPGEGPGWRLLNKASGEEKQIILPAFHPELSAPVVVGKRMAYVGRTQNQGKQQLGCITFDLARGKVLNRQVSDLYARNGQAQESPQLNGTDNAVVCHLVGDRCSGKQLERCSPAETTIALDFEPGSLAKKDLKGAKAAKSGKSAKYAKSSKGSRKSAAKGTKKSPPSGKVAGKRPSSGKSAAKTATPKKAVRP